MLTAVPADLRSPRLIVDRYLAGTRLRLRRVEADGHVVCKLGQKVRPDVGDPSTVATSHIYLSTTEYDRLAVLPGRSLRKTRHEWWRGEHRFAVDEFHGPLSGLWLAEVELASTDHHVPSGAPLGIDVSGDERFSGGALAAATVDAARCAELLAVAAALSTS